MNRPRASRFLRFRITAAYVAFFSLLFAIFSFFVYEMLSRSLEARLHSTLQAQAATAANLFADEMNETGGNEATSIAEAISEMSLNGSSIAVERGERLIGGRLEPRGQWAMARKTVGKVEYTVIASASTAPIAASLAALRNVLVIGFPAIVLLAAAGGFLLSSRALAPVASMARQAAGISGSNLHRRLEIGDAAEELRTLAASFNELLGRLDQSFDVMRRFVSDASHELRTPLSVIQGEAGLALSRERSAADYKESLTVILDESRQLARLVDDLLNLARADAGKVRIEREDLYLNDLVSGCVKGYQTMAASRGMRLEFRDEGDAPYCGDETLLRRMIANLVDNAIRYTGEGESVTVSIEHGPESIAVRVADTGVGIPPEELGHIFERFYRLDKARSRDAGGFGLGLSIVKFIAEAHGGSVTVDSCVGKGSVFTVTLPAVGSRTPAREPSFADD